MKVKSISATNFRSFIDTKKIELSDINIIVGANNSGKSSILRALHQMQNGLNDVFGDVRAGSIQAIVNIELDSVLNFHGISSSDPALYTCQLTSSDKRSGAYSSTLTNNNQHLVAPGEIKLPFTDPNHFIVPYFSKRKTGTYQEDVRLSTIGQITSGVSNLAARLSQVANPSFPEYEQYAKTCEAILGFTVTTIPSSNGQLPGIYLPDRTTIPIEQMGDGVPNIVLLLANLATSKDKLFLIEEPENDLHPQALKALLDLIILSAANNQFVISTHSNIVVTHMCSAEKSKLFKINSEKGKLPTTASIEEVGNSSQDRIRVLQELGYSFSDYDLWEGWLLLEESSAERIIRDYLIPLFVPKLSRIKTVAAGGIDNVEPMFKDLFRVMLFIHLQPAYAGFAWVRVDGDEVGKKSIKALKEKFSSIPEDHFSIFDKEKFEQYYPIEFTSQISEALSIPDKQSRRKAKEILLNDVINWLNQDESRARTALEKSAGSVINELKIIEKQFLAHAQKSR